MTDENKPVIVMLGDYPYYTNQKDAPLVIENAKRVKAYFLSMGFPEEKVNRLYDITVIEDP